MFTPQERIIPPGVENLSPETKLELVKQHMDTIIRFYGPMVEKGWKAEKPEEQAELIKLRAELREALGVLDEIIRDNPQLSDNVEFQQRSTDIKDQLK